MQSEIHWQGNLNSWECILSLESIGIEPELKSPDPRVNTTFRASPKAFIFYGLLKARRPYYIERPINPSKIIRITA